MSKRGEFNGVRGPGGSKRRRPDLGFECLACGSRNLKCTDSRPTTNGNRARAYTCQDCGDRQKTLEMRTMMRPHNGIDGTRKLHLVILKDASLEDLLAELRTRCERGAV